MTNIQIDGQIIKSSIDRTNEWAKVYGRPVSVIRADLKRTIAKPESLRAMFAEADAKSGRSRSEEDMAEFLVPYIALAKKAEKELAKMADLDDEYIIWEKAGYNKTQKAAVNAKAHNNVLSGTVFRVVKVSDVAVP
jgi:hypothetical protein